MTLKEATANSLLMFVAATCVVLIVKAVSPAPPPAPAPGRASAESAPAGSAAANTPAPAMRDGVKVYYLHGNVRCETCRTIEAYAQEAVQTGFAEELRTGQVEWQVINYESPGNEQFARQYEVVAPTVVFARFEGGKQVAWQGLLEVWEHVGNKGTFMAFVQDRLREFMGGRTAQQPGPPFVSRSSAGSPTLALPIPQ